MTMAMSVNSITKRRFGPSTKSSANWRRKIQQGRLSTELYSNSYPQKPNDFNRPVGVTVTLIPNALIPNSCPSLLASGCDLHRIQRVTRGLSAGQNSSGFHCVSGPAPGTFITRFVAMNQHEHTNARSVELDRTLAFRVSMDQLRLIEEFCVAKAISSGKSVSRSDGCRELLDTALRWFPRGQHMGRT
jgi:hypothetical protein